MFQRPKTAKIVIGVLGRIRLILLPLEGLFRFRMHFRSSQYVPADILYLTRAVLPPLSRSPCCYSTQYGPAMLPVRLFRD